MNSHATTESTAATYTERTIRKKSCLNNLFYNSRKHFYIHSEILVSVWSFISSNFPPNKNFKNSPFPLFFFPPWFWKISVPPRFCWVQKSRPPISSPLGSHYVYINDLPQTGSYLYANCKYVEKNKKSLCEWFIDNEISIHFGNDKIKTIILSRKKIPKLDISVAMLILILMESQWLIKFLKRLT